MFDKFLKKTFPIDSFLLSDLFNEAGNTGFELILYIYQPDIQVALMCK